MLIEKAEEKIIEKIIKLEVRDNKIIKVVEKMQKIGIKILRNNK